MKRLAIICLAVLLIAPVLIIAGVKWEMRSEQRKAERAVTDTVRNIRGLEGRGALNAEVVKRAVVTPARLEIFGTNPVQFRVEAHTPWPDWMIYEYDSREPERGVYHYLF
jgi:hypothetical protein